MKKDALDDFATVTDLAAMWGVSASRVRQLIVQGRLKGGRKIGKTWLYPKTIERPGHAKRGPKP